jgi:hypothetical protein
VGDNIRFSFEKMNLFVVVPQKVVGSLESLLFSIAFIFIAREAILTVPSITYTGISCLQLRSASISIGAEFYSQLSL